MQSFRGFFAYSIVVVAFTFIIAVCLVAGQNRSSDYRKSMQEACVKY